MLRTPCVLPLISRSCQALCLVLVTCDDYGAVGEDVEMLTIETVMDLGLWWWWW